jgi:hypothetical protein
MEIKYIAGKKYKNANGFLRLPILAAAAWIAVKDVKKNFFETAFKEVIVERFTFRKYLLISGIISSLFQFS